MFKQRYKDANDKIHAPLGAFARLNSGTKHPARFMVPKILAACLGVFVLATATVSMLQPSKTGTQKLVAARSVKNYEELFSLVETAQSGRNGAVRGDGVMTLDEAESTKGAQTPSAAPQTNSTDYSKTNTQVEGVDEADIVKTDGSYIYRLLDNEIVIVKATGKDMEIVSRIKLGKTGESPVATELFIYGDRLLVISQNYSYIAYDGPMRIEKDSSTMTKEVSPPAVDEKIGIVPPMPAESKTYATVYDIADRTAPKKLNSFGQSGNYLSSRMVGNTVYLISNNYVYRPLEKGVPETFVPSVSTDKGSKLIAPTDIQVFENPDTPAYVILTAIDVVKAEDHSSVKAVMGSAGIVYASADSILVAANEYATDKTPVQKDASGKNVITVTNSLKTKLVLFKIDGGSISEKASATVPGMLKNQFSIDEYKGAFRIVTTVQTYITKIYTDGEDTYDYVNLRANALYTLDGNLSVLGRIEDVAKDEVVYSVRFDGDIGYFVTFRQVDPLFAVDLSDPRSPRIIGSLKIPGFSDYMHVYKDGLLFGFGHDADEKDGRVRGLKLSMFDVSDPANLNEIHSKKLDAYWSDASYNHKAILVNADRSLIAFPAEGAYYVYGYDKSTGFYQKAKIDAGDNLWDGSLRGLFIDDCFYVCSAERITAYALSDFIKLASLKLVK